MMPKAWPHKNEKFKSCSSAEQNKITKALEDLSKVLTAIGKLNLYCATKSIYQGNPASSAPSDKIIAHEFSHLHYEKIEQKRLGRIS